MTEENPLTSDEGSAFDYTRRNILRGALGATATVTAVSALTGVAVAHFPLQLEVDIQPQNEDNFIDLDDHESVRVAVHRTEFLNSDGEREVFDPTEEDVRYRFGARSTLENGGGVRPMDDGDETNGEDDDETLLLEFPVGETGLDDGMETAWLFWERDESGEHGYSGVDTVSVYGEEVSNRDIAEILRRLFESS
ncbi:MAG: hypothetical protein U5J64_02075 [Halobacteriales archaeon]|nr:hypothetical protein [Halobacteriales archaeon]